jgi:tRNA(Leu) C34 or U34 (ribose-2'-O)-methylase TrmL
MSQIPPASEDRRPSVRILACHATDRELLPILWGLEEEGIPADIQNVSSGEAVILAKQAAHASPLNVGIALNGLEGSIVLHHRDLSGECPMFTLSFKDTHKLQLRLLGTNAARLVKGEPLAFERDDASLNDAGKHQGPIQTASGQSDSDKVIDLIVRTVLEILAKE